MQICGLEDPLADIFPKILINIDSSHRSDPRFPFQPPKCSLLRHLCHPPLPGLSATERNFGKTHDQETSNCNRSVSLPYKGAVGGVFWNLLLHHHWL